MPFTAYANLRQFVLGAMDAAWTDLFKKLTDPPTEDIATPYGVAVCAISSVPGPGSNSVERTYTWAISYVFKPDPEAVEPVDVFKMARAGDLVDLIQVVNVGDYGYSTLAPSVQLQPPPEIMDKGLNAVTVIWQVKVNEDHHL